MSTEDFNDDDEDDDDVNVYDFTNGETQEDEEDEEEEVEEEKYGPVVATDSGWPKSFEEASYRTTQLLFGTRNGKMVTCLKKPRDLYALKIASMSTARWPSELDILPDRPYHILYTPPKPEPLWKKGKDVPNLHRISTIFGKVVYDNSPSPEHKFFTTSKSGSKLSPLPPYYTVHNDEDKTLVFESRFECGNLMRAIKVGEYDYQLWLSFDLYTKKHTQWYYFQVKNTRPNVAYRFTIMNFLKSGSLYSEGMKPLLYSERDAVEKNIGWIRAGSNIVYYKNDIKVEEHKNRCYYSLHWTCTFPNENDVYYFAHSYPYTYSDLQEYLSFLASDINRRKVCKQRILCQTLAGNHVYILTITAPTRCPKQNKLKKAIVISARVHPGETVASWMMKGLLDYLTSNEADAIVLRETFVFKIIPMLNPDGVIIGNYRCSLTGRDLNRNYKTVLKDSFPSVWNARDLIKRLLVEKDVALYCDFHGHSRKKNIFLYGCESKSIKEKLFHARVFPFMMNKNIPQTVRKNCFTREKGTFQNVDVKVQFSYDGCRFRIQKSKEGTGRIVMWNMGIRYSYTLEASFCGSSVKGDQHFGVQDYEAMGYHFCDTLLDLFDPDTSKFNSAINEIDGRIQDLLMEKLLGRVRPSQVDLEELGNLSDLETDSFGSDSSVSDGLPMQLLHASIPEIAKKKRLKTRKERNKNLRKVSTTRRKKSLVEQTRVTPPRDAHREKPVTKRVHVKKKGKISFSQQNTKRHEKINSATPKCSAHNSHRFLEGCSQSYVKNVLLDGSPVNDVNSNRRKNVDDDQSGSCERCNPSYYLSFDTSDSEKDKHLNCSDSRYSLFEIRMPSHRQEINPTLELARRITAYNYRTGKVPPRIGQMLSVWANETNRREELLKRRTLTQGDNASYVCQKLASITVKDNTSQSTGQFQTNLTAPLNKKSPVNDNITSPKKANSLDIATATSSEQPFFNVSSQSRIKHLDLPGNAPPPVATAGRRLPKLKTQNSDGFNAEIGALLMDKGWKVENKLNHSSKPVIPTCTNFDISNMMVNNTMENDNGIESVKCIGKDINDNKLPACDVANQASEKSVTLKPPYPEVKPSTTDDNTSNVRELLHTTRSEVGGIPIVNPLSNLRVLTPRKFSLFNEKE